MEDSGIGVLCPEVYLCVCKGKRMFIEVKDNTRIESKLLRGDPQTYRESLVDNLGSDSKLRLPLQNSDMCKSNIKMLMEN
jgi:hypothetical protein